MQLGAAERGCISVSKSPIANSKTAFDGDKRPRAWSQGAQGVRGTRPTRRPGAVKPASHTGTRALGTLSGASGAASGRAVAVPVLAHRDGLGTPGQPSGERGLGARWSGLDPCPVSAGPDILSGCPSVASTHPHPSSSRAQVPQTRGARCARDPRRPPVPRAVQWAYSRSSFAANLRQRTPCEVCSMHLVDPLLCVCRTAES